MRGEGDPARIAQNLFDDLCVDRSERALADALIRIVTERGPTIDAGLLRVTTNWRLDRLGAIERSLLRLGAAELVGTETPPRVVLQEFVRLAERFGGEESARFVNGVLDAFARENGRL